MVIKALAIATPELPLGVRSSSPVGNNTINESTAALWPLKGWTATGFVPPYNTSHSESLFGISICF